VQNIFTPFKNNKQLNCNSSFKIKQQLEVQSMISHIVSLWKNCQDIFDFCEKRKVVKNFC